MIEPIAPPNPALRWYAIYCNIKCEERVRLGLKEKGFTAFLPMTRRHVTHARKTEIVKRPLFPRYIFVAVEGREEISVIRALDGVQAVLGTQHKAIEIPRQVISDIAAAETMGLFDHTLDEPPMPEVGRTVKMVGGPLAGFAATIVATHADRRIDVLMTFLGAKRAMKISLADVIVVD